VAWSFRRRFVDVDRRSGVAVTTAAPGPVVVATTGAAAFTQGVEFVAVELTVVVAVDAGEEFGVAFA
jgi:hypothetical protein